MSTAVDVTRGPLARAVVRLALPVVAMQACHSLYHIVNLAWVGRLGPAATAAITVSFFITWIYSLADLVAVACAATVSRHVGARETPQAAYAATQAVLFAAILGTALAVASRFFIGPLLTLLATDAEVRTLAGRYLGVLLLGAPFYFVYVAFESVLRAAGDTKTPFRITAFTLGLNAVLDPLLIFGVGPFPRLGVAGAALASMAAQFTSMSLFIALAVRRHPALPFDAPALRKFSPRYALAMAKIGAPFTLIGFLYTGVYLYLASLAARFGTSAVAILGIGNRVESTVWLVASGFGLACEAVVGQNLGARRPDRAEQGTWISAGIMTAFGLVAMTAMLIWPEAFFRFFSPDPEIAARGAPYLRVLALNQVFTTLELVMNGAFSGAGDTVPPMVISVVVSILRVPMAWWLAIDRGMGLMGIAWMVTITCVARGVLLVLWFRRGGWRTKQLATDAVGLPLPDSTT